MSERSQRLYEELNTREDLEKLIGQPENSDFDCKEWAGNSDTSRGSIAKAACGFTNATGGVIVIGMNASGGTSDTADVVQSLAPVQDRQAVSSAALDIIHKHVEPGIAGVQAKSIPHNSSGKDGYVLIHVPETEGSPQRTKLKKDSNFYVRITSGTKPMEYFQIEDRFGRRPHPKLIVYMDDGAFTGPGPAHDVDRSRTIHVRNDGRGTAHFPCLRYCDRTSEFKITPSFPTSKRWDTSYFAGWTSIRGGADDVIYPGETMPLVWIAQKGRLSRNLGDGIQKSDVQNPDIWEFPAAEIEIELYCDDMQPNRQTFHIQAAKFAEDPMTFLMLNRPQQSNQ